MKKLILIAATLVSLTTLVCIAGREVGVNVTFLVDSGFLKIQKAYGIVYSDLTNNVTPGIGGITQTATTNKSALSVGSVVTPGWMFLRNLATNSPIQVGPTNPAGAFLPVIELQTGDVAVVRLALPKDNIFISLPAASGAKSAQLEYNLVDQ